MHICAFLGAASMVYWPSMNSRERSDVIDKQVKTTADAVAGVRDGSTVLVAGFGAVGVADICSTRCTNRARGS